MHNTAVMWKLSLLCLLQLAIESASAAPAFDVFLQATPAGNSAITGDSADPLYSGWISVLGFTSGEANSFKPSFQPVTIVKAVDSTTPAFFHSVVSGAAFRSLKMVIVLRAPLRVESWSLTFKNVMLTGQSFSADGSDVTENITFQAAEVETDYIQTAPSGDPINQLYSDWNTANATGAFGRKAPDYPGGILVGGIPQGWTAWYFGHAAGMASDMSLPTDDPDGDGLDNFSEYLAHTNPLDPTSTFRVTATQIPGSGVMLPHLAQHRWAGLPSRSGQRFKRTVDGRRNRPLGGRRHNIDKHQLPVLPRIL